MVVLKTLELSSRSRKTLKDTENTAMPYFSLPRADRIVLLVSPAFAVLLLLSTKVSALSWACNNNACNLQPAAALSIRSDLL